MLSSDTGSATSAKLVGNGNGRSSGTASATRDASAGDGRAIFEYGRLVHAKISTAVVFPERAEREKLQGTVMLRVVLDGEGALRTVIALNSDAEPVLRDAALSAARRASPFPPPPVRFVSAERTLAFTVPLRFFFRK
jgi:protein TonB